MSYLANNKDVLDLIDNLSCMGVRLGKMFFIPGLDAHAPLRDFLESLQEMEDSDLEYLDGQTAGFKKSINELRSLRLRERANYFGEVVADLQRNCKYPFIVQLNLCQNIYRVSIDESGMPQGYGGVWNSTSKTYVFAESIEDAIKQGIKLGQENLLKKHKKLYSDE